MTAEERQQQRQQRLHDANCLICVIGSVGRRFFRHQHRMSRLEMDHRQRLWWHDCWQGTRVYLHSPRSRHLGFSQGGTMWSLVQLLKRFVQHGTQLHPRVFGPWPDWSIQDLWGYGDDMVLIRTVAQRLGITAPTEQEETNG